MFVDGSQQLHSWVAQVKKLLQPNPSAAAQIYELGLEPSPE
jgi:hypothetical protein